MPPEEDDQSMAPKFVKAELDREDFSGTYLQSDLVVLTAQYPNKVMVVYSENYARC